MPACAGGDHDSFRSQRLQSCAVIVLGINDNHDSGAALCVDGEMVAAVGQERIDRTKNSDAFPWDAIDEVLYLAGVRPADIDKVVFGSHFTPAVALRRFSAFHHNARTSNGQYSPLLNAYIVYQVAIKETGLWPVEAELSRRFLRGRMRTRGIGADVSTIDHHEAHAWSAYRSQPHDDALVVTMDAMGDGTSTTVSLGGGGHLKPIWRQSGLSAINTYYSRITEWLGFKANRHEGKITGLAAYAEPPEDLLAHFRRQLHFVPRRGGFNLMPYWLPQRKDDRFHKVLERYTREEIASSMQRNLEHQACAFVQHWARKTGRRHLAVAGGIFSNVKLNQRIHELPEIESIFIYPNMGDGGLAAGAALARSAVAPHELKDVYSGRGWDEPDHERALVEGGLPYERPKDLTGKVADALVDGKVIARVDGRMEWGPRALGNRTVLYKPDDPSVNDWLNKKLKRTEFMPFAPVTLWEHRDECYLGLAGAEDAARFMTICFDCTPRMKEVSAGVVHRDGTARPQLIRRDDNPGYYDIVAAWHKRTGNPSVINTSFNMHEEPIVRSPSDAVRAFVKSELDLLILGPFLARQAAKPTG